MNSAVNCKSDAHWWSNLRHLFQEKQPCSTCFLQGSIFISFIYYKHFKVIWKPTKIESLSISDLLEGIQDLTPSAWDMALTSWIPPSYHACTAQCAVCSSVVFILSKIWITSQYLHFFYTFSHHYVYMRRVSRKASRVLSVNALEHQRGKCLHSAPWTCG